MSTSTRVLPSAEPNVTPMIDVLLVLLIVFMLAVVQVHRTMDVQLPQPCTTACNTGGDAIVLEILPGPSYRLNKADVKPDELRRRLTAAYAGRPNKTILVAGARGVRYDDVMSAMDVAKSAGVTVIGISPRANPTTTTP
jgi:biopolymer transport protein ExbD